MTEARAALAAFDGLGGLERWIAVQRPWQAIPTDWKPCRKGGASPRASR